ncbi:kinase domain protein, putative (macronuclear) [Tetrahymena thermophila SB210]|uniref:Kinase domain protein, putative n=1 Tax=Tetrahymena thermophila (strain SB210) TaxID=312017 RepID=Q239C1_TETTS|nr:kinase domain protein, putative [Tetrahymena thermophila SB210]EAR93049.3 kinase domain protein, putative [Tetrahymena thermophila SB210]|eukprot:XP_001013294.3 kinase domain protein, putative [Tetrahymena thermophila SB210]
MGQNQNKQLEKQKQKSITVDLNDNALMEDLSNNSQQNITTIVFRMNSSQQFGDKQLLQTAAVLKNCKDITQLCLYFDLRQYREENIGIQAQRSLQSALINCQNLNYLTIALNKLDLIEGDQSLIIALQNLKKIVKCIIFLDNCMNDSASYNIGIQLQKCSNILFLNLFIIYTSKNIRYLEYTEKGRAQIKRRMTKMKRLVKYNNIQ